MNIDIICIGKIKEKYWTLAIEEYTKRLKKYCKLSIIEVKEYSEPKNPSEKDLEQIKSLESQLLYEKAQGAYIITLALEGKMLSSSELTDKLEHIVTYTNNHIALLIGGSNGISDEVKQKSDYLLSFSNMTFPHQMMRVILLEQLYRAMKIKHNEPYHK
ncbi:23S rRNA (pseudouridine(1915)-N(3))-methyltransferase RlmH [Liberiplasma polymorphum]|uniref:23S rRNA (pseudouridine(1915)-N(3))-methyltransferase RlmH n=1 Tax=Liberiplasma polymorphum TaxID=3374570 RepID=UPI00377278C4